MQSISRRISEKSSKRDIAIDYLRSSVIVAVVAHHAALAYSTFSHYDPANYRQSTAPVVDGSRFAPLDLLVGWNDIFFMSLMFLISGLFVAPSIARKGVRHFLADRARRLGIPFIVAVTLLSPIAFHPSWLLSDSATEGGYLVRFFTTSDWSPGPAWFIWVLLAFCIIVAIAYRFAPGFMRKLSWSAESSSGLVVMFLATTLVATIPLELLIAPSAWISLGGPLHLPVARSLLYFAWFLMGVALGSANPERSLSRENLKPWPLWLIIGAFCCLAYALLSSGGYQTDTPAWMMKVMLFTAFSLCCTFTSLAALGLARSFFRSNWLPADHFTENAYGIYLFHYGFVIWLQFALLSVSIPAAMKFLIAFSVALTASWLMTAILRKTPAKRFL